MSSTYLSTNSLYIDLSTFDVQSLVTSYQTTFGHGGEENITYNEFGFKDLENYFYENQIYTLRSPRLSLVRQPIIQQNNYTQIIITGFDELKQLLGTNEPIVQNMISFFLRKLLVSINSM